jgi:hypothetical protein
MKADDGQQNDRGLSREEGGLDSPVLGREFKARIEFGRLGIPDRELNPTTLLADWKTVRLQR